MRVNFISIPYDLGKYDRGMGRGPGRILGTGIAHQLRESGYVVDERTIIFPEQEMLTDSQITFKLNSMLARAVAETINAGSFPIILAGNCITAAGALAGIHDKQTGVLWLDAHADFNTPETTRSGYLDGMALSIVCGNCWKSLSAADPMYHAIPEDHVVLLGARELDPEEAKALKASRITVVTADQVREHNYAIPEMDRRQFSNVYIHFDADVLDVSVGRANRFATANGLYPNEIIDILSWAVKNFGVKALGVTAYSPEHDSNGTICEAIKETIVFLLAAHKEKGNIAP